jgi:hypothetical protein
LAILGTLGLALGAIAAWWNSAVNRQSGELAMLTTTGQSTSKAGSKKENTSGKSVPKGEVWEVDFCSRPLVDARGKRVWEIMICNPERTFEFAQYIPNNKVNSQTLKIAVDKLLEQKGAERPTSIRFFRGQMTTIITKAFRELNLKVAPSRRCFTMMNWLEERMIEVYQQDPRFDANISLAGSLRGPVNVPPKKLPDALRGETWDFVQLPLSMVLEETKPVLAGKTFGSSFDLKNAGCGDMSPDTMIPGIVVFSRRGKALAAWTASLEIAAVTVDENLKSVLLETGFNDKWFYGAWADKSLVAEGKKWEQAKLQTRGLHFMAVQEKDGGEVDGFWLLMKRDAPEV